MLLHQAQAMMTVFFLNYMFNPSAPVPGKWVMSQEVADEMRSLHAYVQAMAGADVAGLENSSILQNPVHLMASLSHESISSVEQLHQTIIQAGMLSVPFSWQPVLDMRQNIIPIVDYEEHAHSSTETYSDNGEPETGCVLLDVGDEWNNNFNCYIVVEGGLTSRLRLET
jgi:hypothetical protein